MTNLIADENEFNNFVYNVLPDLKDGEVYFLSLSARNKYLDEDEREYYNLGRTEMFLRTVIRSKDQFKHKMREIGASLDGRRTKSGLPFPEKAMVVYVNINPSNMVKASTDLTKTLVGMQNDLLTGMLNDKQPSLNGFLRLDRLAMDSIQKATGQRVFLDVDLDSTDVEDARLLENSLCDLPFHVVQTHGGYHFLVYRESLNQSNVRLHEVVKQLDNQLKPLGKECMFNSNGMIPLAGTLQAGKLVELLF